MLNGLRWCAAGLLLAASHGSFGAQDRAAPPLRESFDMLVPRPPGLVNVSGRPHLVYELHLTNFAGDPLHVSRIEVMSNDGHSIAELTADALARDMGRPGRRSDAGDARLIEPGGRAVVYFWIELTSQVSAASALTHRVHVNIARGDRHESAMEEGGAASIDRRPPVVLDAPLRGGPWAAVYEPSMERGHRRVIYTLGGRARIPGRFAVDWIKLDDKGRFAAADPSRSANWHGYGEDVLAVADAVVADARDGVAEDEAGTPPRRRPLGEGAGNYVSLDLGDGRFAFYEHLKPGSIRVKRGERVKSGQVIAALGNTGDTSGPHLHLHVADANATLQAEGLAYVFREFELLGRYESLEAFGKGIPWNPTADPGDRTQRMALPSANSVVSFGRR